MMLVGSCCCYYCGGGRVSPMIPRFVVDTPKSRTEESQRGNNNNKRADNNIAIQWKWKKTTTIKGRGVQRGLLYHCNAVY